MPVRVQVCAVLHVFSRATLELDREWDCEEPLKPSIHSVKVPVAQWIEPTFPKRVMRVRFSPGTPLDFMAAGGTRMGVGEIERFCESSGDAPR